MLCSRHQSFKVVHYRFPRPSVLFSTLTCTSFLLFFDQNFGIEIYNRFSTLIVVMIALYLVHCSHVHFVEHWKITCYYAFEDGAERNYCFCIHLVLFLRNVCALPQGYICCWSGTEVQLTHLRPRNLPIKVGFTTLL